MVVVASAVVEGAIEVTHVRMIMAVIVSNVVEKLARLMAVQVPMIVLVVVVKSLA